jgi:hypothetical protein
MRHLAIVAVLAFAGALAQAQAPAVSSRADAFVRARDATWAVGMLRMAPKGQVDQAAFLGTGFFISRNLFVTASHVVNAKLLGRTRNLSDRVRVFKNELTGDGFSEMKIVFDDSALDIAILRSAIPAHHWLSVSLDTPREGDEVALYGYPLVEFADLSRASAFALGRVGMVAGFGRYSGAPRMISNFNVTEGNSGSPVFLTSTARVIAVQTSHATDSAGKNLDGYSISTPLSAIRGELEKLGALSP